jgi:hypothetical protein
MTDRRAGSKQGPYVGKEPRSRKDDGSWRKKRSDAVKDRASRQSDVENSNDAGRINSRFHHSRLETVPTSIVHERRREDCDECFSWSEGRSGPPMVPIHRPPSERSWPRTPDVFGAESSD